MSSPVCPYCHMIQSPKGLAIHVGRKHKPKRVRRIDVDRLWAVLSGMGVIESGTWVSFRREDAEYIARDYGRLHASRLDADKEGEG